MCQYKIVCIQDKYSSMVQIYPCIVKHLYLRQNDIYETKQVEQMFLPIGEGKEKLLKCIHHRDDYSYYHGVHKLCNPLTDDIISIQMNAYDIYVEENNENHVVYDLIKGFSKNFLMIRL